MNAEIFRMIAWVGLIVFFNCIIVAFALLLIGSFFYDSDDFEKMRSVEKALMLVVVIGAIAIVTALDGALAYSMFSK